MHKTRDNNDSFGDFILKYLEYIFVILIILECNSLFLQSENNNDGVWFSTYIIQFCLAIGFLILFLLITKAKSLWPIIKSLPLLAIYYIAAILFIHNNVRPLVPNNTRDYILRFLIFLPLMICIFRYERKLGKPFVLWYRHADLMVIFSVLNIAVFFFLTISPNILQSDPIQTAWSGALKSLCNFYNISVVQIGVFRQVFGLKIFRNFSIFPEPLMFCIPLITALSTELFLGPCNKKCLCRSIILSLAIFTAQSDFGFILLFFIWGLKAMQVVPAKHRGIIYPLLIMIVFCGGLWVFLQKGRLYGNDSLSSLGMHLMDYKYGFMAFRESPLFGTGYWNDSYISGLMSADRFVKNPGLSNSFAVVLGEGGILLGGICLLPYLIGLLQFFHKSNRPVSLWTAGVFGIYAGTIFHFRLYMLMVLAFGFAMLGTDKNRHFSIFPELFCPQSVLRRLPGAERGRLCWVIPIIICAFLLLRKPFFSSMYAFLNSHHFLLGQSLWKTLLLILELVFFVCYLSRVLDTEAIPKSRKIVITVFSIFSSLVYFVFYPFISEWVNVVLDAVIIQTEPSESICLLSIYIILLLVPGELIIGWKHTSFQRWSYPIVIITLFLGSCFAYFKASNIIDYQASLLPESDIAALSFITADPGHRLYANHNSASYHRLCPAVQYTAAKNRGFARYENSSIIFENGTDLPDLFNVGYQVTRLSDDSLLYSNDNAVISTLSDKGYDFYRYYPYSVDYNLGYAAWLNNLEQTESGGVLLDGSEHSLVKGPYDSLDAGEYTVTYMLAWNNKSLSTVEPICTLQVCCNNGDIVIAEESVTSDLFQEDEKNQAELPFTSSGLQNVEYRILASYGVQLEVNGISIQKTPNTVVLYEYDGLEQPVFVRYFSSEGIPKVTADGYYAIANSYDHLGNIITQKFVGIDGEPAIQRNGYAEIRYKRNYLGLVEKESYYDAEGNLTIIPAGFAFIEREYGDVGKELKSERYLDTIGNPILCSDGYAECRYSYDVNSHVVREEYFDLIGNPVLRNGGYSSVAFKYDSFGNPVVIKYYDVLGIPVLREEGYAELHRIYNKRNWIVREEYYGVDGEPQTIASGQASVEYGYDDVGRRISYRYYDAYNRPVVITDGYAELLRTYNGKGQITDEKYLDIDGSPIMRPAGHSGTKFEYDEKGNLNRILFLDSNGYPCIVWGKYSEIRRSYNESGLLISEAYFDLDGNEVFLQ